jgi:hypothetical protein
MSPAKHLDPDRGTVRGLLRLQADLTVRVLRCRRPCQAWKPPYWRMMLNAATSESCLIFYRGTMKLGSGKGENFGSRSRGKSVSTLGSFASNFAISAFMPAIRNSRHYHVQPKTA